MQFVQVFLKTGKNMIGYITNTYGSQIQMLVLKDEALTFTSFSKSALDKIDELRSLTEKEIVLLQNYMSYSKDIAETEYQIRKLQAHSDNLGYERDKQVKELLNQALLAEKKESEVLSVGNIEELLTEIGFRNLFLVQRYGLIVLGEHEEIVYLNGQKQPIPLFVKQAKEIALFLNQEGITKEMAYTFFSELSSGAHKKMSTTSKELSKENKQDSKQSMSGLKITDIQDKLNEHGFQTLRKLQENGLIKIHEDGTIDFGEVGSLPLFKDMLNNPKLLVDVLNQPVSRSFPAIIPLPFLNGVGGFLQELEKQMNNPK